MHEFEADDVGHDGDIDELEDQPLRNEERIHNAINDLRHGDEGRVRRMPVVADPRGAQGQEGTVHMLRCPSTDPMFFICRKYLMFLISQG